MSRVALDNLFPFSMIASSPNIKTDACLYFPTNLADQGRDLSFQGIKRAGLRYHYASCLYDTVGCINNFCLYILSIGITYTFHCVLTRMFTWPNTPLASPTETKRAK